MSKFNDIDLKKWREYSDLDLSSLWIINKRKKDEYNANEYHGNFVPQIPEHFIKRFTKKDDLIIDPFIGSGTTIYEAYRADRYSIGVDINTTFFDSIKTKCINGEKYSLIEADSLSKKTINKISNELKAKYHREKSQFLIFHPPYHDIIKFSNKDNDLSNCSDYKDFLKKLNIVIRNYLTLLEDERYCALVIGDKFENSQWLPLSFYCMQLFQNNGLILKGTIIKNCINTKGKAGIDNIWFYRALASDYYIFKHEYIFLFKKPKAKRKNEEDQKNEHS